MDQRNQMRILIALAVFLAFAMDADAKPKKKMAKADPIAKKLFETNCLACHDPVKMIAGPTLHEFTNSTKRTLKV